MRFSTNGPSIPDVLLERCDAGRVVFLCGAGVSLNSGMPKFCELTKHVIDFFDPPENSEIMRAFSPWQADPPAGIVPLDQIFNLLHQEYGRDEVNVLVTERLRVSPEEKSAGYEHSLMKRISSNQNGIPQIVTTNFDLLFEFGNETDKIPIHVPSALSDLAFRSSIDGITYLHGRLVPPDASQHPYVLSSADFGRAYLSEAWATKFIRELLERHTVVLVGYRAEDPPVKYLLQGLKDVEQFDRTRLYAFDRGGPEEIEAKWRDRGVTSIAYQNHEHLWQTMEAWADRADDPRAWRSQVVTRAKRNPKEMSPHERGQVAHVLRSIPGAKAFADAEPSPHPEWVCVLDACTRNAKRSSEYGEHTEEFDPVLAYGLDDDLGPISEKDSRRGVRNDNLLEWRNGDDNPPEFHRVSGRAAEGFEAMPTRLGHLVRWIGKSYQSPVIAWWAARQHSLHPRLIDAISRHLDKAKKVDENCRQTWNLILEYHRDPRNRRWNDPWYDLKKRIAAEGWVPSVLRDFHHASQPYLNIRRPMGLHENKPPTSNWGEVQLDEIARIEVKYLERHIKELDIPDQVLPVVFGLLVNQLSAAAGMLSDLEVSYFPTPTCFPDRETDGGDHHYYYYDSAVPFLFFIALFDRMVTLSPKLAMAHATLWDECDPYFFRKLKLYALSKHNVFDANDAARIIFSFDQKTFWDKKVVRELLFALVDRWVYFSEKNKQALAKRIVAGPDRMNHWSEEEYPIIRDQIVAKYGYYLRSNNCDFPDGLATSLTDIIAGIPDWTDDLATAMVMEHGVHGGLIERDITPDEIIDLPVNKIVDRAKTVRPWDTLDLIERRPFIGLVKANPRKALSALSVAAKNGEYPAALWSALVNELPADVTPRLRRVFLYRLARLPHTIVNEIHDTLGQWLEQNLVRVLEFDGNLGWVVFDHVVDGILNGGADDVESSIDKDGPLGMCAKALFSAIPVKEHEAGSLVPGHIKSRLERIFAAPEKGSERAACIAISKLNRLMYIDPYWTKEHLIPLLAFDHPVSETAWKRLLISGCILSDPLAEVIKPLMLDLFPWIERFSWSRDISWVAVQWLGRMRVFYPNKPSGLTKAEMRSVLRAMSDDSRSRLIFWLGRVGQEYKDGWVTHVVPFVNEDWPREKQYRTSESVKAWIGLLDDTEDNFPATYEAVKKFLAPVEMIDNWLYRFIRTNDNDEPLTVRFPESTLDLMNSVTPSILSRTPYELPKVLALIVETDIKLKSDPRYLRLIELVERS